MLGVSQGDFLDEDALSLVPAVGAAEPDNHGRKSIIFLARRVTCPPAAGKTKWSRSAKVRQKTVATTAVNAEDPAIGRVRDQNRSQNQTSPSPVSRSTGTGRCGRGRSPGGGGNCHTAGTVTVTLSHTCPDAHRSHSTHHRRLTATRAPMPARSS